MLDCCAELGGILSSNILIVSICKQQPSVHHPCVRVGVVKFYSCSSLKECIRTFERAKTKSYYTRLVSGAGVNVGVAAYPKLNKALELRSSIESLRVHSIGIIFDPFAHR